MFIFPIAGTLAWPHELSVREYGSGNLVVLRLTPALQYGEDLNNGGERERNFRGFPREEKARLLPQVPLLEGEPDCGKAEADME